MLQFQKHIVACLAVLVIFASCKKNDKANTSYPGGGVSSASPTSYRIKQEQVSYKGSNSITDYTYSKDGNVKTMTYSDGVYSTFEWTPALFTQRTFSAGSSEELSSMSYKLDAAGNATTFVQDNFDSKLEYTNGFLTVVSFASFGSTTTQTYQYKNGNLVGFMGSNGSTASYEYYLDKPNTIGNLNKGIPVFGNQSKNLVKKIVQDLSGSRSTLTYNYEFDSQSRVVLAREISDIDTTVTKYSYY